MCAALAELDAALGAWKAPAGHLPHAKALFTDAYARLVAMKLVAGREKDHLDLHYILTAAIDYKLARNIVKKHLGLYAAEELDGMREEARWMKGRAK